MEAEQFSQLVLDQDNPQGYSQWEHKSTPTYANGRVCIVGDAAHATTPWQGFGTGMAIEDAMVLGVLFRHLSSSAEVGPMLRGFDAVRRGRCEKIIHSSNKTGEIMCGMDPDVQLDLDKLGRLLFPRWELIDAIDYVTHEKEALGRFRENIFE